MIPPHDLLLCNHDQSIPNRTDRLRDLHLAFEQVQDTFEPLHVFQKLFTICLDWHQDHGEDIISKLRPLFDLKSTKNVPVILL